MSYTLADGLSTRPKIIELADYWEIECMKKADFSASILDIVKSKIIAQDVQEEDADEQEFKLEEEQINVINEIKRRINSCPGMYPFQLDSNDSFLTLSFIDDKFWVYIYLLLATRNNMTENKVVLGIDGTKIFEKLSRDMLSNYLGGNSKGLSFGTASAGNFHSKLEDLVNQMKEGEVKKRNATTTYNPQDDKLDIVVWIPFFDTLPSKLICFGQCKTGTHWLGSIKQLSVSDFLKKWFATHPVLNPLETFIITDVVSTEDYYDRSVNNLFFDRFRVASFAIPSTPNDWFDDLKIWTKGILDKHKLSVPVQT